MSNQDYYVTFLRHGESVGNAENRFQGQADFSLTEKGRAQAEVLAERWQAEEVTFDLCISSPLARARETAEIIAGRLKVPIVLDPNWMEMDNGRMAGLTDEEAGALDRPQFFTPYTPYGETGESRWELYLRAGRGIQSLLNRPAGRYLIVAHGAILNMTMYTILGIAPQAQSHGPRFFFRNTTFTNFVYNPDSHNWRMLSFERTHWPPNGRK